MGWGELRSALGELHLLVMSVEDDRLSEKRRPQIVDEMPFAKSRIVADMRIMLMERRRMVLIEYRTDKAGS